MGAPVWASQQFENTGGKAASARTPLHAKLAMPLIMDMSSDQVHKAPGARSDLDPFCMLRTSHQFHHACFIIFFGTKVKRLAP